MKTINLRDYYPLYTSDCFIDVPDEVAALLLAHTRYEAAYQRRTYRHRAHYSLDRSDGIEHDILFVSLSPCEIYERKITNQQLHAAIASLPDKQAKRILRSLLFGYEPNRHSPRRGREPQRGIRFHQARPEKYGAYFEKLHVLTVTKPSFLSGFMKDILFPFGCSLKTE